MTGKGPVVISVINSKGGVSKTTTAVNLVACASLLMGKNGGTFRSLLIDMDPQMNATRLLLEDENGMMNIRKEETLWRVFRGEEERKALPELIHDTRLPGVSIVPSSLLLSGVEMNVSDMERVHFRLRSFIERNCGDFDLIVVDNGPSVNVFSINSLLASNYYLIATTPEKLSIDGLDQLEDILVAFSKRWNSDLDLIGVVITMADETLEVHRKYINDLKDRYDDALLGIIHTSGIVKESDSRNMTLPEYDSSSEVCLEFMDLARRILAKLDFGFFSAEDWNCETKEAGGKGSDPVLFWKKLVLCLLFFFVGGLVLHHLGITTLPGIGLLSKFLIKLGVTI